MISFKVEDGVGKLEDADFDFDTGFAIALLSFVTVLNKAVNDCEMPESQRGRIVEDAVENARQMFESLQQQWNAQFVPMLDGANA